MSWKDAKTQNRDMGLYEFGLSEKIRAGKLKTLRTDTWGCMSQGRVK